MFTVAESRDGTKEYVDGMLVSKIGAMDTKGFLNSDLSPTGQFQSGSKFC